MLNSIVNRQKTLALKGFLFFTLVVLFAIVFSVGRFIVFADDVTTSVTVGNSAPTITVAPAENSASDATTPTNVGSQISFTATATDANSENYYLAICKTNQVTAVNGSAPTCNGGNWCISSSTASGSQASCNYSAIQGDVESNDWYAFVCDGNSSSASCSASSQGSGSSGSPFKVNHAPAFDTVSNDGPKNPGETVTWSTSAVTDDPDTDTVADTVKLVVCKTAGISSGDCDGGASDRWCQSTSVASNPSCGYSIPTPTADDPYTAYVYVVDNHDFASAGAAHGTTSNYTVNNVAPVVSTVTINGGLAIDLTEGTTSEITLKASVTDNNSCQDVSAVLGYLYRSGIAYSSCNDSGDSNANYCYADISCSVASSDTCDGSSDATADYECDVNVQYHADPTVADTQFPSDTWKDTIKATDDDAAADDTEVSSGVELNTLIGYDVTSSIAYGSLAVGAKNDPLDKTTTVTNRGNVGLDQELRGTNMSDGGVNSIAVTYQRYALAALTPYASGTQLTLTDVLSQLDVSKTTVTASPQTKNTWWGLEIPAGTVSGTYTGTNTITALASDYLEW